MCLRTLRETGELSGAWNCLLVYFYFAQAPADGQMDIPEAKITKWTGIDDFFQMNKSKLSL